MVATDLSSQVQAIGDCRVKKSKGAKADPVILTPSMNPPGCGKGPGADSVILVAGPRYVTNHFAATMAGKILGTREKCEVSSPGHLP